MRRSIHFTPILFLLIAAFILAACTNGENLPDLSSSSENDPQNLEDTSPEASPTPTITLTICLGEEIADLPQQEQISYQVVGTNGEANLDMLLSGGCDVLDYAASQELDLGTLKDLESGGQVLTQWRDGEAWEAFNFGIMPQSYDDGYSQVSGDRADFFGDPRTRQAFALCIDRQKMADQLASGQATVMNSYISENHLLYNPNVSVYPYDPGAGKNLLAEVGWVPGADGIRVASGIAGIFDGTRFEINYEFPNNPQNEAIAQIVREGLLDCGVQTNLSPDSVESLFTTGPNSPLFGRNFDLAQFSWQTSQEPPCRLWQSDAIPGEDLETFLYGWGGWNLTGWRNQEFDAACLLAQNAEPGDTTYTENHFLAQAIFAEQLPSIPLFTYQEAALAQPGMCDLLATVPVTIELIDLSRFCN